MTTPSVHELPRRLEPVAQDTFLTSWPYLVTRPYPTHRRPIAVITAPSRWFPGAAIVGEFSEDDGG